MAMPVMLDSRRLVGNRRFVSMPVWKPNSDSRVFIAITISSSEQLPARSPMPLMVHSTWRAPARTAARLLATAMPRSLWQCTLKTTLSAPFTFFFRKEKTSWNSSGTV